jgi:predicted nucleic acid-binding protein
MSSFSARADFFDASALVKVYAEERHSHTVRTYFNNRSTKYTTSFCFYETLSILKGKLKRKVPEITREEYLSAASLLTYWYGASSSKVPDLKFTDPTVFAEARGIAERSGLDLSDAFQILSVKHGYFSVLANESSTVLVTADGELASAAEAEGLRVWNILQCPAPN